jgi:hypothetical protein
MRSSLGDAYQPLIWNSEVPIELQAVARHSDVQAPKHVRRAVLDTAEGRLVSSENILLSEAKDAEEHPVDPLGISSPVRSNVQRQRICCINAAR